MAPAAGTTNSMASSFGEKGRPPNKADCFPAQRKPTEQARTPVIWAAGREKKSSKNSPTAVPAMITVKRNRTRRRKMVARLSSQRVSLFHALILRFAEESFARPVLQQITRAQSFFV